MSRGLSATIKTEIAKLSGVFPRTIACLALDGGSAYFIDHDEDLLWDGVTWQSWRMTHSAVKTSMDNKVDNCTLELDNADLSMSSYLAAADFSGRRAYIKKIFLAAASCQQNGTVLKGATTITYDTLVGTFPASGIAYINGEKFTYTGNTGTSFTGCSARLNDWPDNTVIYGEYPVGTASDYVPVFDGFMSTPEVTESKLSVRITSKFDRSQSTTPWRRYTQKCNWQFCGTECAYNGSSRPSGTADSGTTTTLVDAALIGSASMAGGLLKITGGTNKGYARYIQAHDLPSGTLWVDALPAAVDNTSTYEIDCDKSLGACSAFNNYTQFGGFNEALDYRLVWNNQTYSSTYSWALAMAAAGREQLIPTGDVIPLVYGQGKVEGRALDIVFDMTGFGTLHVLYGLAEGEIDSVVACQADGVDKSVYSSHLGDTGQIISFLTETKYFRRTAVGYVTFSMPTSGTGEIWNAPKVDFNIKGIKVQKYLSDGSADGSPVWSQNRVWCAIDFLLNRAKKKLVSADIDWAYAKATADACDAAGDRINLVLAEAKKDTEILDLLLGARVFPTYAGSLMRFNLETTWSGPVAHSFDDSSADNIKKGSFQWSQKDLNDVPNRIIVKYRDEEIRASVALCTNALSAGAATIAYSDAQGSFSSSGTLYIGQDMVTYSGLTATEFTGCSGLTVNRPAGYPIFQGTQLYTEETAIYDNEISQAAIGRVIDKTITSSAPTYELAYREAELYSRKQVDGNTYCSFTGLIDSMDLSVGDVAEVTHTLPGWSGVQFRLRDVAEGQNEELEYSFSLYDPSFYIPNSVSPGGRVPTNLPSPYAAPGQVTNLSVVEELYAGADGTWLSRLIVTYDAPLTNPFWKCAEIWISLNGGTTWRSLGKDYSQGTDYVIESVAGKFTVGDAVTVRAVSISTREVAATFASAPSVTVNILGKYLPPSNVTGFTAAVENDGIRLRWNHISDLDLWAYEIRLGTAWEGASLIATGVSKDTYFWWPTTTGSLTFLIKAIDTTNNYSTTATSVSILTAPPSAVTGLTAQVVDNNVFLRWTGNRGSFPIDYYEIRKGATFATAEVLYTVKGNFTPVQELLAGTYTYWVVARDTAGLYGAEASVATTVEAPPRYVLLQRWEDDLLGTRTNMAYEDLSTGRVGYVCVDTAQTVQEHFTDNACVTTQDLIDLGYTYAMEPMLTTGSYEHVMDYGTTLAAAAVNLSISIAAVAGAVVGVAPKISVSPDGSTWTDYEGSYRIFASSFRYVKVLLTFTGATTKLSSVRDIVVLLDVKEKDDAGNGTVSSAANGLVVQFNKDFVDIESINVTGRGSTFSTPTYVFTDQYGYTRASSTTSVVKMATGDGAKYAANDWIRVPLPDGTIEYTQISSISTDDLNVSPSLSAAPGSGVGIYHASFTVYLWDAAGNKITGSFGWQARGY